MRQRYTVTARPDSEDDLVERLLERFARRERSETERIQNVLSLVTHDGCQVRALVGYFGETRGERCEHCSHCLTGYAQQLPQPEPKPPIETMRRRRGARGPPFESSGRAWSAKTSGPLPLRHHEPGDDPREVDAGTALRLARRAALRRRARLVRGAK